MEIQLERWLNDHKQDSSSEVWDFVVKVQGKHILYTHAHICICNTERNYIEFAFDLHFIYKNVKELFLILTIYLANSMQCLFH